VRALLAAAVSVLVAAPAAGAARPHLLVRPDAPVVGKRATIEVRTARPLPRLSVVLFSPTGVTVRVRLHRAAPTLWRASYHFPDDGQWLLRAASGRPSASIWVQQGPAALPPFRPATGKAHAANVLGQGSFLLP
jgi:hypothetical protein